MYGNEGNKNRGRNDFQCDVWEVQIQCRYKSGIYCLGGRLNPMKTRAERKKERDRERLTRQFHSPERIEWVKSLPCEVTKNTGIIHNAHMKSRGAGGTWHDIVPMVILIPCQRKSSLRSIIEPRVVCEVLVGTM